VAWTIHADARDIAVCWAFVYLSCGENRRKKSIFDSSVFCIRSSLLIVGPIPWGHSGPLCHALSSLSWTSMRSRRATVPLATSGELAWGGSLWWMGPTFFKCFLLLLGRMSLSIEQKWPIVIEHSSNHLLGWAVCVCMSSALWQNGWSDMDPVWDGSLDGSSDEAEGNRSMGGSPYGCKCGVPHCNQWGYRGVVRLICKFLLGNLVIIRPHYSTS